MFSALMFLLPYFYLVAEILAVIFAAWHIIDPMRTGDTITALSSLFGGIISFLLFLFWIGASWPISLFFACVETILLSHFVQPVDSE